jgi:hypothetical protein
MSKIISKSTEGIGAPEGFVALPKQGASKSYLIGEAIGITAWTKWNKKAEKLVIAPQDAEVEFDDAESAYIVNGSTGWRTQGVVCVLTSDLKNYSLLKVPFTLWRQLGGIFDEATDAKPIKFRISHPDNYNYSVEVLPTDVENIKPTVSGAAKKALEEWGWSEDFEAEAPHEEPKTAPKAAKTAAKANAEAEFGKFKESLAKKKAEPVAEEEEDPMPF